jgi:hypothetical protein
MFGPGKILSMTKWFRLENPDTGRLYTLAMGEGGVRILRHL